jgi:hypothetical protein
MLPDYTDHGGQAQGWLHPEAWSAACCAAFKPTTSACQSSCPMGAAPAI